MSLTIVDAYKFAAYNGATDETWYAKLYYGDESAFVGISSKDMVLSGVTYYGIVTDWGEITETIDLANSSASISDMSINCANVLKGGKLSDVIYGTSTRYINRKVEVFSYLNATSLQLYTGKLINISFDIDSVTLNVEGYKPWQGISVPQILSPNKVYSPIAYGDFVADTLANFFTSKALHPMPFEYKIDNTLYFVASRELASGAECYFYDSGIDKFVELDDSASATVASGDVDLASVPVKFSRVINFRGTSDGTDDFSATSSAYDEDSDGSSNETTSARYPSSGEHTFDNPSSVNPATEDFELIIEGIPEPIGKPTAIYLKGRAAVTLTDGGEGDDSILVGHNLFGGGYTSCGVGREWSAGAGTTGPSNFSVNITTAFEANNFLAPDIYKLIGRWNTIADGDITGHVNIYDTYLYAEYELVLDEDNKESADNFLANVKHAYCGADGLSQSFTDGSGLAQLPHEILRDLLARFTDFDFADTAWPEWSDLDTARSGWNCRWWQLEPRELEEILRQIQFEGCFIFKINNTATGARLIWVDDDYSSADFTFDENDYESINVSLTDMAEIETFTTYNYQRHPAKSAYIETTELNNSTARGYWLTGTLENKIEKNLDFITSDKVYNVLSHSDPNDCLALYYDNIKSSPKIIVDIDMTNMAKIAVEVGDIVQFNDANINPFGKDWADVYFMVIETRRGINSISVKAREVYEA